MMKNVMLHSNNYCCVTSISNAFPFFRLRVIPPAPPYAHTHTKKKKWAKLECIYVGGISFPKLPVV